MFLVALREFQEDVHFRAGLQLFLAASTCTLFIYRFLTWLLYHIWIDKHTLLFQLKKGFSWRHAAPHVGRDCMIVCCLAFP